MASKTFQNLFLLRQDSQGQYSIDFHYADDITVTDQSDGRPESLSQIGDISQDTFYSNFNGDSSPITYIGRTNAGIVAKQENYFYLFSDRNYQDNYNLSTFKASAPSDETTQFAVCFAAGTLIRTAGGDVAVEQLRIGDRVVTASGEHRPVRWLGHRVMACQGRADLLPVRIARDAFGANRPARDLLVSPAHAIAVDVLGEVLIPACRLINGTTITQEEAESIVYWHVELDSHDILLAEGLPAESYLDCGNRRFFGNADLTDLAAVPDTRPAAELPFCRPFHETGPLVDLVRARLTERAEALGWHRIEDAVAGLHLVADGRTIRPDVDGLTVRFVLSAQTRAVRLVSTTGVPTHTVPGSTDDRRLGVSLAALTIDDGLTGARSITLDDPRLEAGFHALDGKGRWRWTDGDAELPASLWQGCRGTVFLRLTLAAPALPRWVGPTNGVEAEPVEAQQRA